MLQEIYSAIPDLDDFSFVIASYAQSAASAYYYTLKSVGKINVEELSWALVLARDTVDLYVQEIEGDSNTIPVPEHRIMDHPVMQRELRKQEADFSMLINSIEIDESVVRSLLDYNNGRSNIDIT